MGSISEKLKMINEGKLPNTSPNINTSPVEESTPKRTTLQEKLYKLNNKDYTELTAQDSDAIRGYKFITSVANVTKDTEGLYPINVEGGVTPTNDPTYYQNTYNSALGDWWKGLMNGIDEIQASTYGDRADSQQNIIDKTSLLLEDPNISEATRSIHLATLKSAIAERDEQIENVQEQHQNMLVNKNSETYKMLSDMYQQEENSNFFNYIGYELNTDLGGMLTEAGTQIGVAFGTKFLRSLTLKLATAGYLNPIAAAGITGFEVIGGLAALYKMRLSETEAEKKDAFDEKYNAALSEYKASHGGLEPSEREKRDLRLAAREGIDQAAQLNMNLMIGDVAQTLALLVPGSSLVKSALSGASKGVRIGTKVGSGLAAAISEGAEEGDQFAIKRKYVEGELKSTGLLESLGESLDIRATTLKAMAGVDIPELNNPEFRNAVRSGMILGGGMNTIPTTIGALKDIKDFKSAKSYVRNNASALFDNSITENKAKAYYDFFENKNEGLLYDAIEAINPERIPALKDLGVTVEGAINQAKQAKFIYDVVHAANKNESKEFKKKLFEEVFKTGKTIEDLNKSINKQASIIYNIAHEKGISLDSKLYSNASIYANAKVVNLLSKIEDIKQAIASTEDTKENKHGLYNLKTYLKHTERALATALSELDKTFNTEENKNAPRTTSADNIIKMSTKDGIMFDMFEDYNTSEIELNTLTKKYTDLLSVKPNKFKTNLKDLIREDVENKEEKTKKEEQQAVDQEVTEAEDELNSDEDYETEDQPSTDQQDTAEDQTDNEDDFEDTSFYDDDVDSIEGVDQPSTDTTEEKSTKHVITNLDNLVAETFNNDYTVDSNFSREERDRIIQNIKDRIRELPDDLVFLTHLSNNEAVANIAKTGLNTGVAIESTTNTVFSKKQLEDTLIHLVNGGINHRGAGAMIIIGIPKSMLGSQRVTSSNVISSLEEYLAEYDPTSFAKKIPSSFNVAAFINGNLVIKNNTTTEDKPTDATNTEDKKTDSEDTTTSTQQTISTKDHAKQSNNTVKDNIAEELPTPDNDDVEKENLKLEDDFEEDNTSTDPLILTYISANNTQAGLVRQNDKVLIELSNFLEDPNNPLTQYDLELSIDHGYLNERERLQDIAAKIKSGKKLTMVELAQLPVKVIFKLNGVPVLNSLNNPHELYLRDVNNRMIKEDVAFLAKLKESVLTSSTGSVITKVINKDRGYISFEKKTTQGHVRNNIAVVTNTDAAKVDIVVGNATKEYVTSKGKSIAALERLTSARPGAFYTVIKSANNESFPLRLHSSRLTKDEAELIYLIYSELANDKTGKLWTSPIQDSIKSFIQQSKDSRVSQVPGSLNSMTYSELLSTLVYEGRNASGNKKLYLDKATGALVLGSVNNIIAKDELEARKEDIINHLMNNFNRQVNAKKLSDPKYKAYIINNDILTTNARATTSKSLFAQPAITIDNKVIDVTEKTVVIAGNKKDSKIKKNKEKTVEASSQNNNTVNKVKEALKVLNSKTLRVNPNDSDTYIDEEGNIYDRVSTLNGKKTFTNTEALDRGTIIDSLLREYISGNISSIADLKSMYSLSNKGESKPMDDTFIEDLYNIFKEISSLTKNLEIISTIPTLWGTIFDKNVAGTIDLLAIDKVTGDVFIIDLKTSTRNRRDVTGQYYESNKKSDSSQQSAYAELLYQRTGIRIKNVVILPIQVFSKDGKYTRALPNKDDKGNFTQPVLIDRSIFKEQVKESLKPTTDIEAKKADIERKTGLKLGNLIFDRFQNNLGDFFSGKLSLGKMKVPTQILFYDLGNGNFAIGHNGVPTNDITFYVYNKKGEKLGNVSKGERGGNWNNDITDKSLADKINTKYNAELAALEGKSAPTDIEAKKADAQTVRNRMQEIEKTPVTINITQNAEGKMEQTSEEVVSSIKSELDKIGLPYSDVVANDKGSTYFVVTKDGQQHEILKLIKTGNVLVKPILVKAKWINHLIKTQPKDLYDFVNAELAALEGKPTKDIKAKKADIERRLGIKLPAKNTSIPVSPKTWGDRKSLANQLSSELKGVVERSVSMQEWLDKGYKRQLSTWTDETIVEFLEVADTERRRQEELKERVVYDIKPTVEDGEFRIIGDPNNRIFRINEITGRPQVLDKSNGLWSNTAESPNMFFETTKRSGFEKIKENINAKYDAELTALEDAPKPKPDTTSIRNALGVKKPNKNKPSTNVKLEKFYVSLIEEFGSEYVNKALGDFKTLELEFSESSYNTEEEYIEYLKQCKVGK